MSQNLGDEEAREAEQRRKVARVLEIGRECAALPVLDAREPDEMLYDEQGLPK